MTTKLTLVSTKSIIEKAKRYAQEHNRSLSQIVTHYLEALTEEEKGRSKSIRRSWSSPMKSR